MNKDTLKDLIISGINCAFIEVKGEDGRHFEATVVSSDFEGLSMLNQHKRVYATLGNRMETDEIHALSLKTFTIAQWEQKNAK